ncbi:MAG: type II secretion system F family protein, partial [Oscillospiraceae bacterium]|nr:type II secretion system F family protein [Oscillospiraceae bacterium]
MIEYGYVAVNSAGAEQRGSIAALNQESAQAELKRMGLLPLSVKQSTLLTKNFELSFFDSKPKPRDLSVFCRQFVSILDAGVPLIQALDMLSGQSENKLLARTITSVKTSVEKGDNLETAFAPHTKMFGRMFIPLVAAGEASGSLSLSMTRMADQYEKDAKVKAMVKKASIYPTILLSITIAVMILMLVKIVPTFEDMFAQMGTELPAITKLTVAMSDYLQSRWYVVVGIIVAIIVGFKMFVRTELGKKTVATATFRIPIISNFTVKTAAARMSRTLSTLMGSGMQLIESLRIAGDTMSNLFFRNALFNACDEVSIGVPLSESIRNDGHFPNLLHQMLAIGEESGTSEKMLNKVAEYYEEEVEAATAQLMSM